MSALFGERGRGHLYQEVYAGRTQPAHPRQALMKQLGAYLQIVALPGEFQDSDIGWMTERGQGPIDGATQELPAFFRHEAPFGPAVPFGQVSLQPPGALGVCPGAEIGE